MTMYVSVATPLRFSMGLFSVGLMAVGLITGGSCSSNDDGFTGGCPTVTPKPICTTANNFADEFSFVTPTTVHTGWNGRDTYESVLVANFGQFELKSSDENIVCAARFDCPAPGTQGVIALMTAQSPGDATVTVTSADYSQSVDVVVTSYTALDYDLGEARYLNPADGNGTTRRACGNCHLGQGGAPHSPLALAQFSDRELIHATINSEFPGTCEDTDGVVCSCIPTGEDCSACSGTCTYNAGVVLNLSAFGGGPGDHLFDLTSAEEVGIMAFMRAIEPGEI